MARVRNWSRNRANRFNGSTWAFDDTNQWRLNATWANMSPTDKVLRTLWDGALSVSVHDDTIVEVGADGPLGAPCYVILTAQRSDDATFPVISEMDDLSDNIIGTAQLHCQPPTYDTARKRWDFLYKPDRTVESRSTRVSDNPGLFLRTYAYVAYYDMMDLMPPTPASFNTWRLQSWMRTLWETDS